MKDCEGWIKFDSSQKLIFTVLSSKITCIVTKHKITVMVLC